MNEKNLIFQKIEQVIAAAEQFSEDQFNSIIEGLVKKGGSDAEKLLMKFFTFEKISVETRKKVITSAGYIKNPLYLVPLKKILDQNPNIHLKKVAITAIAQYNNQQALNILNNALPSITNPYLLKTLNDQITLMKKNNPILALLPRFLKSYKDRKSFSVLLDLLKKNLDPSEADIFTNYLKSDEPILRAGAFEILCFTGDRNHQSNIFDFFFQWANQLQSEALYILVKNLKQYLLRFPSLIFPQMSRLKSIYAELEENRSRREILSIFCHCRAPKALSFIKEIYNQSDPEIKEFIIEESAGNEQAVEFLFERFKAGQILKGKILKALLNSQKGYNYFVHHFLTFSSSNQELIIQNLPEQLKPYMIDFIRTLFQSDLYYLKKFLIHHIKNNYLFSCKEILFNPKREKEFNSFKDEYLNTITQLFPVSSVGLLLEQAAKEESEIPLLKNYLNRIAKIIQHEIVLNIRDPQLLPKLVTKVIKACSSDLNEMVLDILEHIKTFDTTTYKNLYDALYTFMSQRGDNLIEEEAYFIKRIKENFHQLSAEIKTIEALDKEVKRIFLKSELDLGRLKKILISYHMGAGFKIISLIRIMAEYFESLDDSKISNWRILSKEFPLIMQMVREARNIISSKGEKYWHSQWKKHQRIQNGKGLFHYNLRIIIKFRNPQLTAVFKDQLEEILPYFNIKDNPPKLTEKDILLCDSYKLKEYIEQKALVTSRIFLLLENRSEFSYFKSLNPRAFFPPISIHRVLKLILPELYLVRK